MYSKSKCTDSKADKLVRDLRKSTSVNLLYLLYKIELKILQGCIIIYSKLIIRIFKFLNLVLVNTSAKGDTSDISFFLLYNLFKTYAIIIMLYVYYWK